MLARHYLAIFCIAAAAAVPSLHPSDFSVHDIDRTVRSLRAGHIIYPRNDNDDIPSEEECEQYAKIMPRVVRSLLPFCPLPFLTRNSPHLEIFQSSLS